MSYTEIYYRGKAEILDGKSVEIILPEESKSFMEFTVQIIPSYRNCYASLVENGKFTVYGPNGFFFWNANGFRFDSK